MFCFNDGAIVLHISGTQPFCTFCGVDTPEVVAQCLKTRSSLVSPQKPSMLWCGSVVLTDIF